MAAAPDCDVLIVGAGPTGSTLALLLAREGLEVTLADREADIYPLPRAAHIDHEALRIFQAVGLAAPIAASSRSVSRYDFLNRAGEVLLRFDGADAVGPGGWPASNMIHQPSIERVLRDALAATSGVSLRPGWELRGLAQDGGGVRARFGAADGGREVTALYLVGADGARSPVREAAGLGLEDLGFDEPWLVVDTLVRDPARLPAVNLQICDPERPTTCVLMGSGRHRWEFMIKPGETPEQVTDAAFVHALLEPWEVAGAVEIERKAVYRFSARLAERWRSDRVMVAGDAAHTMPPFAGQGLCSGLRDAANLSWKLAAAVRTPAAAERLLATYQPEREPQVRAIVGLATMMGRTVCTLDPAAAAARDAQMLAARAAGAAPSRADWPPIAAGCVLGGSAQAGSYFPQVGGDVPGAGRLDDVLGAGAWLIARPAAPPASAAAPWRALALGDPALAPFRAALEAWLDAAGVDAVLVRPDRYVFGTGSADGLASAYAAWVSPPDQGVPPMPADTRPPEPDAPSPGLDGVYEVVVKSPLGDEALRLTLATQGAAFTGVSEGPNGVADISGAVAGSVLTWTEQVTRPFPVTLDTTMTVTGDEVAGTVKAGAFGAFPLTGRRASSGQGAPSPATPAVARGAVEDAGEQRPQPGERPSVFRLAYVDLTTPSVDRARAYYEGVLGLKPVETSADAAFLSLGLDHHNLVLRQAARESLAVIGLQAAPHVPLADLRDRLAALGFAAELKSDARPGAPTLVEVSDVGGHRFQIVSETPMAEPSGEGGGVAPLKLGHVAVLSPDPARLLAFLQQGLGFFATDWFDQLVTFVTCNQDHHVLNVAAAPVATLHHLAFLLGGADHQVRAADLLTRHDIPTLWGPARHTAGHNIASYHHGADRALIELYNDMDVFSPELGYCEPRPWHGDRPQRPKRWPLSEMTRWNTRYEFALSAVEFGLAV